MESSLSLLLAEKENWRSGSWEAVGKASRPVTSDQAQRHTEEACIMPRSCSILPWAPWTPCCLFGKSCQQCFPINIIWAMLQLCCYSKTACSENAPWRLVYTVWSRSARIRLPRHDFSFRLPCGGYALLPLPRLQSRGLRGRKTPSRPNHRMVWDLRSFPSPF